MMVKKELYIDGQWQPADGAASIAVVNPFTEEVIAEVPNASATDVDKAVAAASAALEGWSRTPVAERAAALRRIADGLIERKDEIATTISSELGMPIKQCRNIQLGMPIGILQTTADEAEKLNFEDTVGNSTILREPVGVIACIAPWNYPLHQIAAKIAPALAAGCTVIVKPSEVTPLCAFLLAEVIDAAGLPAGVFNLVAGDGPGTGEMLASHPDVDMISFTGSTRAGKQVGKIAAESVKRIALDLGGKSAAIILDDADLVIAVKSTLAAALLNSGQTCAAHTRLLVAENQYDEVKAIVAEAIKSWTVGDPREEKTRLGPLVSRIQRDRVRDYIEAGIQADAEVIAGSRDAPEMKTGFFVNPLIFGKVDPKMTIAQEEIFGPVISMIIYKDDADAIRIANDSIYELSGAVWSSDTDRSVNVARQMRTGQVSVNGGAFNILAPFGGYKQSGIGRENGRFGIEEYLETKAIQL